MEADCAEALLDRTSMKSALFPTLIYLFDAQYTARIKTRNYAQPKHNVLYLLLLSCIFFTYFDDQRTNL